MIRILIICLFLISCGGSGGSSSGGVVGAKKPQVAAVDCLANKRNCSDEDVDLNAPVRWAADNGIEIVLIRWAGCSDEASSKYAFERGVTIICHAGDKGVLVVDNSPYNIVVGTDWRLSNYGPGVDYVFLSGNGSVHAGIFATALLAAGEKLENHLGGIDFPKHRGHTGATILIVDNGFDSVRPLYTLYKNTALAGEITGDFGIKALNMLQRYVKADVIGYVPFNTLPENPRIDRYIVAVPTQKEQENYLY